MASSQKFRDYVVNQFSGEFSVTTRKMMGEYILYSQRKIFGGIYDDRLLVKDLPEVRYLFPQGRLELPYEGAKPMVYIPEEKIQNTDFLNQLLKEMLQKLPASKSSGK
jgi:TfoX/Sxy family transcriptional regulator of competence genes